MSDKDIARRTAVEVFFDGTDISQSLRTYFISLTYTDNEENESDDLQISIADRDNVWLCQWLNDAIQSAANAVAIPPQYKSNTSSYKVTAKSGLNVRAGAGTSYRKLGMLAYGTKLSVSTINRGWANITYSGHPAYVSAKYITVDSGKNEKDKKEKKEISNTGLRIQAAIVCENRNSDGIDKALSCGQFELDSIDAGGPPATITIKGTSLPYDTQIRQTKKSKAWESYNLSGIAREMSESNGMTCLYLSVNDPAYQRVEQYKTSDIEFLSTLCHDTGISLKVSNNIIILFDQATYEEKPSILAIRRGDGSYSKYKLSSGTAGKQYTSCRVRYAAPGKKKSITATAYVKDYDAKAKNNQQLELTANVASIGEAKMLAEKRLRLHNKYALTASFTMMGNPDMVAGTTITLSDWGMWDGKYIVSQAKHTVSNSGYTLQINLRKVLEGY